MRAAARAAGTLLALLVCACAQFELEPGAGELEFDLSGRLAARYGDESLSASVAWRHGRLRDEMLLSTPLGQGLARITREGDSVTLRTAEPREYRAADAESLTAQVLGFRLPLRGLAQWVQARPAAGSAALTELSQDGKLRTLEQDGWTIEYQEYDGRLPSRLRLTYPGIELRLAISQWK